MILLTYTELVPFIWPLRLAAMHSHKMCTSNTQADVTGCTWYAFCLVHAHAHIYTWHNAHMPEPLVACHVLSTDAVVLQQQRHHRRTTAAKAERYPKEKNPTSIRVNMNRVEL